MILYIKVYIQVVESNMLKYAVLGLLSYQPMSGYHLKQSIDNTTSHFWHANLSQIYVVLKDLEKEGKMTSAIHPQEGRPDGKIYTITETGLNDLRAWLAEPLTKIEPVKDTLLLKIFFSAQIDKEHLLTTLRLQRSLYGQLKQSYNQSQREIQESIEQNPSLRRDAVLWEVTRRSGELSVQFYAQWLDEAIATIETEL